MYKEIFLVAVAFVATSEAFAPIVPEIHVPKPFSFGYVVKDKHGEQHRQETGDGVGVVKGSYGFTDERGIHREVTYIADKAGFRAVVKTNEHGTAPMDPAAVKMISSAHPYLGGAGGIGVLGKLGPLSAGPLAAESFKFGVPAVAPELLEKDIAVGYGGPLLAGAVKGYDSRFGAY